MSLRSAAMSAFQVSSSRRFAKWAVVVVSCAFLFGVPLLAQHRGDNPDDSGPLGNETSAGGKWTVSRTEDRMTAAKRVRFELPAENIRDSDDSARVVLYCSDGKLKLADFHPSTRLSRPNWPGFWGQPQMRVRVRIDDAHDEHNWNWINGHFLAMDKGTTREILGARLFRVEFNTPRGSEIAEFSPAGIDLSLVRNACGLTPKKP